MVSVADLVDATAVEKLARPADIRLGREIVAQGGVEVLESGPLKIIAKAGGVAASQTRRTVMLQSTTNGLTWSCTCTKKADRFCKHCVATALATLNKAPPRRG